MDSLNTPKSHLEQEKSLSEGLSPKKVMEKLSSVDVTELSENVRLVFSDLQEKINFFAQNNEKLPIGIWEMVNDFLAKYQKTSTISQEKVSEIFS